MSSRSVALDVLREWGLDSGSSHICVYVLYILEETKNTDGARKALRRDLATNLTTEPCDNLATYLATDALRRRDVCGESLATDLAMETL